MPLYLRLRKHTKDDHNSVVTMKETRTRINESLYTTATAQEEIEKAIKGNRRAAFLLDKSESRYYKFSPDHYSSIIIERFPCP